MCFPFPFAIKVSILLTIRGSSRRLNRMNLQQRARQLLMLGSVSLLPALAPRPARADQATAIVPIVAYNPTYKLILGGAYFNFPDDSRGEGVGYGIQVLSTFTNNIKLIPEYRVVAGKLRFEVNGRWTTYYDPYYGEGSNTNVNDLVRLDEESGMISSGIFWQIDQAWSTGPIFDLRYRQNRGVDGDTSRGIIEPEQSAGYGWRLTVDERDTAFSSKAGNYLSMQMLNIPVTMTTTHKSFRVVTVDARQFYSVWQLTFAFRLNGGLGSTDTSYLYRARLGGTDQLRGFYTNRFRGDNFLLGQAEMRFEIIPALSLVAFTDAGNVGDPVIRDLKQTYGGGVRFGLPPDWVKKARLDFAFAKDQSGVSFVFDETF